MSCTRTLGWTCLLALLALATVKDAWALDTFGPPFGANRYVASIQSHDGVPDADDYVTSLVAGESLSVTCVASKGSALVPVLELVAPDGAVTAPTVKASKADHAVKLTKFAVTSTGRWGVRVSGRGSSEGGYTIGFVVAPAKVPVLKPHLGGADPLFVDVPIEAIDGALVDVTVKYKKGGPVVHIGTMRDPAGTVLENVVSVEKPGRTTLSQYDISGPDGTYLLRIFVDSGEIVCSISVKVTPQGRPKSKKPVTLSSEEPALDPVATPILGVEYRRIHLTGSGFGGAVSPTVYFARAAGTGVAVASDGRSLDVTVPPGTNGATVSVAVVSADGQGVARDGYFHYVPPPVIPELLLAADQQPTRGGTSLGGVAVRLLGTGFAQGHVVRFGSHVATGIQVVDSTTIDLVTPAASVDSVNVYVDDEYGRALASPFLYSFKAPPVFASIGTYTPPFGPLAGGVPITIAGLNFEPADRLFVDGVEVASTFAAGKRTFSSPARSEGFSSIALVDRFGLTITGPDFEVRGPATVDTVTAVGGSRLGTNTIATGGGAIVEVVGTNLSSADTVVLGGVTAQVTGATNTLLTFIAPPGSPGFATLTITDPVSQSVTVEDALRFIGFQDQTATHSPGATATDDLTAQRGVMADLDEDGNADDLVIVSDKSAPGNRSEFTRIFLGDGSQFVDSTSANFPAAFSDPFGVDDWRAQAVAVGDLDGSTGREIVVAGATAYQSYYSQYGYEARVFTNDGSGSFSFDTNSPYVRTSSVTCTDGAGSTYDVFSHTSYPGGYSYYPPANRSRATALALGDLDGDGKNDIVMATDTYRWGYVHIAPNYVTFNSSGTYVDTNAASHFQYYSTTYYAPGLRIFRNGGASGFKDVTFPRLPLSGAFVYPPISPQPALAGRDTKLADIDGDGDLDIVVAWDDPLTTTPIGIFARGTDPARVATHVLLNNGAGFFSDATTTWLPTGSAPEYWQASRCELIDLDADGDRDLVLLLAAPLDAYSGGNTTTRSSLRILRNQSPTAGFQDITTSVLPSVPLAGTRDDNLRGSALVVRDIDGDGKLDIVVGTTEQLVSSTGGTARSTRLLRGGANFVFTDASGFLPAPSSDSGEADDLAVGDIAGNGNLSLVILTESFPQASPNSESLRVLDWDR